MCVCVYECVNLCMKYIVLYFFSPIFNIGGHLGFLMFCTVEMDDASIEFLNSISTHSYLSDDILHCLAIIFLRLPKLTQRLIADKTFLTRCVIDLIEISLVFSLK